jgi:capsular exopolysaccharide synthesis family protein
VLATIPSYEAIQSKSRPLLRHQQADTLVAEQYRLLYTRVVAATTGKPKTIFAISSAIEGEGKTITAMNLGLTAARDFGKHTLLIEGDFKHPSFQKYLGLQRPGTLMDVLCKQTDLFSSITDFGHPNLSILPFGHGIKNSVAMLTSQEFADILARLRERYDLILIDAPPILSLPDMLIIEQHVDAILMVVRAEITRRDAVIKGIQALGSGKLQGIVFNGVQGSLTSYYHRGYTHA